MEIDLETEALASNASTSKKLKHNEDPEAKFFVSTTVLEGCTSESIKMDNANNSTSDLSFCNDKDSDDIVDEGDDILDYDDEDDYMYDDDANEDNYLKMQAQFDNVDLPPGVEASVSWLSGPTPSSKSLPSTSTSLSNDALGQVPGTGFSSMTVYGVSKSKNEAGSSSSTEPVESSSAKTEHLETEDEVLRKFQAFKRFDTVTDFSDHHFNRMGFSEQQPPKSWTKKVQGEWKILEKDLPDTIFVRVYETRMDLLRAIIVGPSGTPYHDGLFVFDVLFPTNYPDVPPMVYYYSGGLRLNPNLYDCGKVCLSLLNTWSGNKNEMWMPTKSTMLQVLVSIQALILNADPFFNEPGYDSMYPGEDGQKRSKKYNEDMFILSLKTMMYTMRRPPKYFEDFVSAHFRLGSHKILSACKAYLEGAEIGSLINDNPEEAAVRNPNNHPGEFKGEVSRLINNLVSFFMKIGSPDCEQFRVHI